MTHVELSGFGINCKSSIAKDVLKYIPNAIPIMSDSAVIADMATRYWANYDPEERCRFRYHTIKLAYESIGKLHPLIIDRGIIDQICFARMIDKGILQKTDWENEGLLSENYEFISEYIPYELAFPFKRLFIYTKSRKLVQKVLNDEYENQIEKRSFFSKSVDRYFELQEMFYQEYKAIIPEFDTVYINDNIGFSVDCISHIVQLMIE